MSEVEHVYVVVEARPYEGITNLLRAFSSEESAEDWRDDYVEKFEYREDEDRYHIGMGQTARFGVQEVPLGSENDSTAEGGQDG